MIEYVNGRTLRDVLREGRRFLPERAMEIIDGVLWALGYGHRDGIVHRDVKPGNVMMTRTGDVKVMNFGVAKSVSNAHVTMTMTTQVIGTAHYLSPEQARGARVDARSDIYSAGCLLYDLLTGRPPFTSDSPIAIAYQHVRGNPVPPSRLDPEIPGWADAIVLRAMARDPADRYQSAGDMRDEIQRALSGTPAGERTRTPAPSPPSRSGPSPAPSSRPGRRSRFTPAASPAALKRPKVVRVSEASTRRSEPLGDEVRSFNNAKSSSTAVETIRVSHVSRVSASVDLSKTRALSGSAGLRFVDIVSAQASLEKDLVRHYSLGMDAELTLEQTTVVNVPAHTNVEVIFHWSRIWATGMLTVADLARRAAEVAEIPFEITVSLAFDKETRSNA